MTPPTEPPEQNLTTNERSTFRQYLTGRFSLGELKDIVFDLGYDHENLPGSSKPEFVRELLAYCEREGALAGLLGAAHRRRPDDAIAHLAKQIEQGQASGKATPSAASDPPPSAGPSYTQHADGSQGSIQHNQGTVIQNFGPPPKVRRTPRSGKE